LTPFGKKSYERRMAKSPKAPPTPEEWVDALEGNIRVVRAGLDAGFDPSTCPPTSSGRKLDAPLNIAQGRTTGKKIALLLIERGADPNQPDAYGMTPLMWAASHGDSEIAEALLEAGADPHAKLVKRDKSLLIADGLTPLEIALADRHKKTAELLRARMSGKPVAKESPFEEKLSALREAAFPVIDFEGSEDDVEEALVGVDRPDCFSTIGKTGSDSVFALWRRKPDAALETAPVVYLDSEGDPRSVVATSLDAFLSVLPYGSGTLYDLLSNPARKLAAKKALESAAGAEEDVDDKPFLSWWKHTFGVAPAKDPAAVLAAAAKATKAFQKWLAD
jgi:Ankyrin repeats (3 copies)